MSWTDERVDLLKKLWSEGLSASQIASRIGSVTRNAVIGKVHRLGLSGRATTSRSSPSRARPRITAPRRITRPKMITNGNVAFRNLLAEAEPYVSTYEEIDIPLAERRNLIDLEEKDCRWPIGDPQLAEFHFCNRNKVTGLPYCEFHARRAFQPPQPRRRDRVGGGAMIPIAVSPIAPQPAPAPAPAATDKEPVDA